MCAENQGRKGNGCSCGTSMEDTTLVRIADGTTCGCSGIATEQGQTIGTPPSTSTTSVDPQDAHDGMQGVRQLFRQQGFSSKTIDILLASWKPSTRRQYGVPIRRWLSYCGKRNINPIQTSLKHCMEFFTDLFETGLG